MDGQHFHARNAIHQSAMNEPKQSPSTPPKLEPGMRLEYYRPGEGKPNLFSAEDANVERALLNAFAASKVVVGTRPGFNLSERGAVFTVPKSSAASNSGSSGGFHPFKVYNPTGAAANTFRVRGGYVWAPELFPASTTQREIDVADTHVLQEVSGTDGISWTSDDEGSSANDLVLDDWDNGAAGVHGFYSIWAEIYQVVSSPGVITMTIQGDFGPLGDNAPPGFTQRFDTMPGDEEKTYIPIARIIPTGYDGTDITGARIVQFQNSNVSTLMALGGQSRFIGTYTDDRIYYPGDIVFSVALGEWFINVDNNAIIGYVPGVASQWVDLEAS